MFGSHSDKSNGYLLITKSIYLYERENFDLNLTISKYIWQPKQKPKAAFREAATNAKLVAVRNMAVFPVTPPSRATKAKSAPINWANLGAASFSLGTGPDNLG
jgi:hypothetical protein